MKKFTVVFFFLMVGVGTMMAQADLKISSDFEITVVDGIPKDLDLPLTIDISQLNFENEARANQVLNGYAGRSFSAIDLSAKTATLTLPKRLMNNPKFTTEQFPMYLRRLAGRIKGRANL